MGDLYKKYYSPPTRSTISSHHHQYPLLFSPLVDHYSKRRDGNSNNKSKNNNSSSSSSSYYNCYSYPPATRAVSSPPSTISSKIRWSTEISNCQLFPSESSSMSTALMSSILLATAAAAAAVDDGSSGSNNDGNFLSSAEFSVFSSLFLEKSKNWLPTEIHTVMAPTERMIKMMTSTTRRTETARLRSFRCPVKFTNKNSNNNTRSGRSIASSSLILNKQTPTVEDKASSSMTMTKGTSSPSPSASSQQKSLRWSAYASCMHQSSQHKTENSPLSTTENNNEKETSLASSSLVAGISPNRHLHNPQYGVVRSPAKALLVSSQNSTHDEVINNNSAHHLSAASSSTLLSTSRNILMASSSSTTNTPSSSVIIKTPLESAEIKYPFPQLANISSSSSKNTEQDGSINKARTNDDDSNSSSAEIQLLKSKIEELTSENKKLSSQSLDSENKALIVQRQLIEVRRRSEDTVRIASDLEAERNRHLVRLEETEKMNERFRKQLTAERVSQRELTQLKEEVYLLRRVVKAMRSRQQQVGDDNNNNNDNHQSSSSPSQPPRRKVGGEEEDAKELLIEQAVNSTLGEDVFSAETGGIDNNGQKGKQKTSDAKKKPDDEHQNSSSITSIYSRVAKAEMDLKQEKQRHQDSEFEMKVKLAELAGILSRSKKREEELSNQLKASRAEADILRDGAEAGRVVEKLSNNQNNSNKNANSNSSSTASSAAAAAPKSGAKNNATSGKNAKKGGGGSSKKK